MLRKIFGNLSISKLKSYLFTFVSEIALMVIGVILFKLIALKFDTLGFSEYTIGRRLMASLAPVLMIGLGVSLPKYLSIESNQNRNHIHYSALFIISSLFLLLVSIFLLFSDWSSQFAFGDTAHKSLFGFTLLYTYSLMLHNLIYNYFRGRFEYSKSSILQLLDLGLIPLLAYYFSSDIVSFMQIASGLTILVFLTINIFFIHLPNGTIKVYGQFIKKLCVYGIKRTPGDILIGLFLSVPTFIISNYYNISLAGEIGFSFSLLNIVIGIMSPINIILLPEASSIVNNKDFTLLKTIGNKLLLFSILIGVGALIGIALFGSIILELFGIKELLLAQKHLLIIFTSVIGYSVFGVIRSIIDAYYESARVSSLISISFFLFIALYSLIRLLKIDTIDNILFVFSISLNALGLLTFLNLRVIYKNTRKFN